MPLRIVLLGAPASGKGTQAALLGQFFGVPNLSTGALIRAEQERGTQFGKLADGYLEDGGFLPDDLMLDIMGEWLTGQGSDGFVLDGFPRTLPQAEAFDSALESSGHRLDTAVLLEIDEQMLQARIARRIQCNTCGITLAASGGFENADPCPQSNCSGSLSRREDDAPEVYANRLEKFHRLTGPVVRYYDSTAVLKRVDGGASSEDVFQQILNTVKTATT